jgi:pimeloyl-ACP methyl ester carboxylesterase
MSPAMDEATADGLRIRFDDRGAGEPALLLLPGWAVDRRVFDELASLTSRHRRTLALDWRGHGDSDEPGADFGIAELVEDAVAVVEASGVGGFVPVAQSHAGWVALELLRRLPARIPKLVFVSWIVLDPPPPFVELLRALATPEGAEEARERLFSIWLEGVDDPRVVQHVREQMGRYGSEMFRRAAREILAAYERHGAPLHLLAELGAGRPALHVYSEASEDGYLSAQRAFARDHPWFEVERVSGRTHLVLEAAAELARRIEAFTSGS